MKSTRKGTSALMLVAMLLAACSGGGGLRRPRRPTRRIPVRTISPRFRGAKDYMSGAQYVAPVTNGSLGMQIQVRMRNPQRLMQYAKAVSDPASPLYRRFLTPEQIADQFGAAPADYAKAAAYFRTYGLHVGGWKQREQTL